MRVKCSECRHEFNVPTVYRPDATGVVTTPDAAPGMFRSYVAATGCLLAAMVAAGVGIGGGLRLVAWVAGW